MTTFDELRQAYADDPTKLAEIEAWEARGARVMANKPAVPPCPPWCRYRELFTTGVYADHSYDSTSPDERTYSRFHVSDRTGVYIAQEEFNTGGVVTLGAVHVSVSATDGCEELTAADARRQAAALMAAADRLDTITGNGG